MTLRARQLGRSLQEWRELAGITRATVAAQLECSTDKVRHFEHGRTVPERPTLQVLCELYNIPKKDQESLFETRTDAKRPGWWQTYKLPLWLASYVMLEDEARTVRAWSVESIPGLLQTGSYARKLEHLGASNTSSEAVDKWVNARMKRQERLTDESLKFEGLISEAAIERCAYDRDVGREQLAHLIQICKLPNVSIRIVPINSGLHPVMACGFILLDFPSNTWPVTGYQEYAAGGHLVDDADAVADMDTLFTYLRGQALSDSDSGQLIARYQSNESER